MKNSTKYMMIGAGVVVCLSAIAATSHAITQDLIKIALDREEPKRLTKAKEKITLTPEMDAFNNLIKEKSELLAAKACEEVEITSRDGEKLIGHWYPCKDPKRVIVAMHGWRSSWTKDFGMIADFWHENGCSVLYAEQRGQNNSGGEYMTFGFLERYDCLDWIHWVNAKTEGKLPVYLGGVSMGASTVLMTAGLDLPENVRGVVADCGFTSANAIWKYVMEKNLRLSYGMHEYMINNLCKKKIHSDSKEISTLTALPNAKVPVLFIHGSDDTFVPIEMTYENYKACAAPKKLLVVPGAGHGQSYYINKEEYESAVKSFWKDHD